MSDSASGISQATEEMTQTAGEVVKDVKDQVGQAIEQGVQSVVGAQLTPQQLQQKELDRQKKLAEVRRKVKWYQDLEATQKRVREEQKQKQMQVTYHKQQEEQEKKIDIVQKRKELPIAVKTMGKAELKRGVGG